MNLYFATGSARQAVGPLRKSNVDSVLFSYAFFPNIETVGRIFKDWRPKRILLDSGAFSVWTKGKTIDIDKYIAFAKEVKTYFEPQTEVNVINLDVLPGTFGTRPTDKEREESAQKGWQNMFYIEERGLTPIHVFHQHEDFKWLDMLRNHSKYIGISPANDVSVNERGRWLDKVFSILKASIKTHAFGVTSSKLLQDYPFYSADSSSWTVGPRFGRIPYWDGQSLKTVDVHEKETFGNVVRNVNIERFAGTETAYKFATGIEAYKQMEQAVTALWANRGITYE